MHLPSDYSELVSCKLKLVTLKLNEQKNLMCLSDVDQIVLSESGEGELGFIYLFSDAGSPPLLFCCLFSPDSVSDDDTSVAQMNGRFHDSLFFALLLCRMLVFCLQCILVNILTGCRSL